MVRAATLDMQAAVLPLVDVPLGGVAAEDSGGDLGEGGVGLGGGEHAGALGLVALAVGSVEQLLGLAVVLGS